MYKALISFTGIVTMAVGEVKDIKNKAVAEDLLRAGYIEEVKEEKVEPKVKPEAKPEPEPEPKTEEAKPKPKKTKKK